MRVQTVTAADMLGSSGEKGNRLMLVPGGGEKGGGLRAVKVLLSSGINIRESIEVENMRCTVYGGDFSDRDS